MTTTSRRAILAGIASTPALATTAALPDIWAPEPDPIADILSDAFGPLTAKQHDGIRRIKDALARSRQAAIACDPIFPAIEAHRAACRAYSAAVEISAGMSDYDPRHRAAELETDRASAELDDAGLDLATAPTTLAGIVALIDYITECAVGDNLDGSNWRLPYFVSEDDGGEPAPPACMTDDHEDRDEHYMRYLLRSIANTLRTLGGGQA